MCCGLTSGLKMCCGLSEKRKKYKFLFYPLYVIFPILKTVLQPNK